MPRAGAPFVRAIEGGGHFAHEAIHFVFDLLMWLEPTLATSYLLQRVDDPLR